MENALSRRRAATLENRPISITAAAAGHRYNICIIYNIYIGISNRTKRRKMKQDLDNIKKMYSMNHSNNIQIELISNENEVTPSTEFLNVLPISTCKTNQSQLEPNSYLSENLSPFSTSNETSKMYEITEQPIHGLLNAIYQYPRLPRDTKTLLATPKRPRIIRDVHPGHYYHFGLAAGIKKYGTTKLSEIEIDGLPLSKSTFIINNITKKVFPVGVYYGRAKPSDSNDFLTDFISEEKQLIVNGIILNGICKKVSIKSFCMQCSSKSIFTNNQRLFRFFFLHLVCPRRTHDTYINILYEEHHIGEMSRLVELPGLDLVHSFSLDYMHLVCLGAVKN
ncbi:hypothetical protein AGLY_017539 [Aphis glycines]|uniref:Uncharacterized protein n=1 Tax=Aphis glycines TaxID=307491 RepID=A0A6G0SUK9_APHGL|nr:hypothetical protein AGLY_017539 [Aphis glycines]